MICRQNIGPITKRHRIQQTLLYAVLYSFVLGALPGLPRGAADMRHRLF